MKKVYTTSKVIGLIVFFIAALGWGIAIFSSPAGFQIDPTIEILGALLVFIFAGLVWGTKVTIEHDHITRTESFLINKTIAINDIKAIRYQPTYGLGKEFSSLYIFGEDNTAAFTMTNLWYGEKKLQDFVKEVQKLNSAIRFDDEADALIKRSSANINNAF